MEMLAIAAPENMEVSTEGVMTPAEFEPFPPVSDIIIVED